MRQDRGGLYEADVLVTNPVHAESIATDASGNVVGTLVADERVQLESIALVEPVVTIEP